MIWKLLILSFDIFDVFDSILNFSHFWICSNLKFSNVKLHKLGFKPRKSLKPFNSRVLHTAIYGKKIHFQVEILHHFMLHYRLSITFIETLKMFCRLTLQSKQIFLRTTMLGLPSVSYHLFQLTLHQD